MPTLKPISKKVGIINRTDTIQSYFNELIKSIPLKPEIEIEYIKKYKTTGDEFAKDKVITANLRFVVMVAHQYQNQGVPLSDLINEGNMGLVKAIDKFNPNHGVKFISYAVWWIRQYIMRAIQSNAFIKIPHNVYYKSKIDDSIVLPKCFSLDMHIGDEDSGHSLMAIIKNHNASAPDEYYNQYDLTRLLKPLSKKEQEILKFTFGLNGIKQLSYREIGDIYGITHQRIQQIVARAIMRLQHIYKPKKNNLDGLIYK